VAPLFITLILVVAQAKFSVLESYDRTALAISAAIATEIVLSRLLRGEWPHLASAYISGISAGILVRSNEVWPYVLCAVIAITSKYVLRIKGRHLWNPTNFAISVLLILAPFAVSTLSVQWHNGLEAMLVIWALGSVIVWRLHRFHICVAYVAAFVAFAFARSLYTGHTFEAEVAPITGPMYQLFIFFMITDPKTTVGSKRAQCAVVIMVAAVESLLRLNQNIHAPYYALFMVGPAANLVDIWLCERRKKLAAAQPEAAQSESAAPAPAGQQKIAC
jgi:Na+-translocating ferredoxin:NAD+ oxidoreductase RnfD subunit